MKYIFKFQKHLNFKEVCQLSGTLFETPELIRGAESWIDWRLTPVDSKRALNTPLESSTPVSARLEKLDELVGDVDKTTDFTYSTVLLRQPYLRVTPARLKYSRSMKEINQDNRRKLIVVNDTRLTETPGDKNGSSKEADVGDKSAPKRGKQLLNSFKSESILTKIDATPTKKKTLSRCKASVSLAKPNDSPPGTPRRRAGNARFNSQATIAESQEEEIPTATRSPVKSNHFVPESGNREAVTVSADSQAKDKDRIAYDPKSCVDVKSKPKPEALPAPITNEQEPTLASQQPKQQRKIVFGDVSVYHFARTQGWVGVPKEGGNTLGMEFAHFKQDTVPIRAGGDIDDTQTQDATDNDYLKCTPGTGTGGLHLSRPSKVARLEFDEDSGARNCDSFTAVTDVTDSVGASGIGCWPGNGDSAPVSTIYPYLALTLKC